MTGSRAVAIESLGVYLPDRVVTTGEVVDGCVVPLRMALEKLSGIRSHRQSAPGEFALELAGRAIDSCLARSRYDANAVDLLICASISHGDAPGCIYAYEPCFAMRLKAAHGLRRAIAFDIANGCAGMWTAMLMAERLIASGAIETALIASGEYISDLIRTAQREAEGFLDPQIASLTVGDSGAAVLLAPAGTAGAGFAALDLYTLGHYAPLCVARPSARDHGGAVMLTDTLRLGARAIEHVVSHFPETMANAGWTPRDIEHLIPHQTSEMTLIDGLRRINKVLPGPITATSYHINLAERGNTATTTHLIALEDAARAGRIRAGDRAGFVVTGSGLTVGTALYRFDDLPDRIRHGRTDAGADHAATGAGRASFPEVYPAMETPVASVVASVVERGEAVRDLTAVELCRRVGDACLTRAGWPRDTLDLLLHAGVYRTDFVGEPATAALAAGALDVNAGIAPGSGRRTLAADLLAGHLGTLKALWVIERMMRAGRCRRAMILTADVEIPAEGESSYGLEPSGSALLVERAETGALLESCHFRDFPEDVDELHTALHNPDGRPRLRIQRRGTFHSRAADRLITATTEYLAALGMPLDSFDAVFMPGIPAVAGIVSDRLGIADRQQMNVSSAGELLGASFAAALAAAHETARSARGTRALVLACGAGIQTGCATIRFA
jgi:3-oxoacyl-[acyl-carrier-protein] synthase III